jgi:hypothetical protein
VEYAGHYYSIPYLPFRHVGSGSMPTRTSISW